MKPLAFKTTLLTVIMLCFTSMGAALAQTYRFARTTRENVDGTKIVHVEKYKQIGKLLERQCETEVIYDELKRPVSRSLKVWCEEIDDWIPCRTYTYNYVGDSCVVQLTWSSPYKCCNMKDEAYTFSLKDTHFKEYLARANSK